MLYKSPRQYYNHKYSDKSSLVPTVTVKPVKSRSSSVESPTSHSAAAATTHLRDLLLCTSPEITDDEEGDDDSWHEDTLVIDVTGDSVTTSNRSTAIRVRSADSTTRNRLFESDSDEDYYDQDGEDNDEDDEDSDLDRILTTPSSLGAPSSTGSSSLSRSTSWPRCRRQVSPKPTLNDPLLLPSSAAPMFLAATTTTSGWLPSRSTGQRRSSLSSTSPTSSLVTGTPLSQLSAPTSTSSISLLTQSLRSLVRLPNLSLPDPSPPPPRQLGLTGLDLDRLVEESPWDWRDGKPSISGPVVEWDPPEHTHQESLPPFIVNPSNRKLLRRPHVIDNEHSAAVQLQTFSFPSGAPTAASATSKSTSTLSPPPSPVGRTIDLPPCAPLHIEQVDDMSQGEIAEPTPQPVARYISNQRHLLMLSVSLNAHMC